MAAPELPLSYEALKSVMKNLEANRRFLLATQYPSLRTLHQILPMKVQSLTLAGNSYTVNNIEYSFNTMVETFPQNDEILGDFVRQKNAEGGARFEVDNLGIENIQGQLEQGDVQITQDMNSDHAKYAIETVGQGCPLLRMKLLRAENRLARVRLDQQYENEPEIRSHVLFRATKLPCEIPFNERVSVRLPDGVTLGDSIRTHFSNFLSGENVRIEKVKINATFGTFRFPLGFRLRFQQLSVCRRGNPALLSLHPVFDNTSLPINKMEIDVNDPTDALLDNNEVINVRDLNLNITDDVLQWRDPQRWIVSISNLRNEKLFFRRPLIEDWFAQQLFEGLAARFPRIGTSVSVQTSANSIQAALDHLVHSRMATYGRLANRRCKEFPRCVTVQLNATTELNGFGFAAPNHDQEFGAELGYPWILVFEVMEFGSAVQV